MGSNEAGMLAVNRVMIRDLRRLGFVFRRGGAKVHLTTLAGGVRLVQTKCGRALHDDQGERLVFVFREAWWPSDQVCVRCVSHAQAQRLIVLTPYTEADQRRDERLTALMTERIFAGLGLGGVTQP